MALSSEEKTRYHRQIMIPEIGEDGQEKLKAASVFLSGLGGLGSVSGYYMAAAGVGRLRIVDRDDVELQNLNRQIIHWTEDIKRAKTESAFGKLARLNPLVKVESVESDIEARNVEDLVDGCDLILDATDNLGTRKLLNRASVRKGLPFIFGGVDAFNGMVSTFVPGQSGCLECLFQDLESTEKTVGVIGPLPGLVASIQALEAVKLILGMEGILKGRLLLIDGRTLAFREIRIGRNPDCPICQAAIS